jgi:CRP-like cAMP-binding protein
MFFKRHEVSEGEVVFDFGHKADKVYFIESGSVEILAADPHPNAEAGAGKGVGEEGKERVNKISAGGVFGEAAFFLDLPHSVRCISLQNTRMWTLDRSSYVLMETSNPQVGIAVRIRV